MHILMKRSVPESRIHPAERDGSAGNNRSQAGSTLLPDGYFSLGDTNLTVENFPGPGMAMIIEFHRIGSIPYSFHTLLKIRVFINMVRSLVKHSIF